MFGDPYYLPQIQRIFLLFAASSLPTRKEIVCFRRALNPEMESGALLLLMQAFQIYMLLERGVGTWLSCKLSLLVAVFDAAVGIHLSLFLGTGVKELPSLRAKLNLLASRPYPLQMRTLPSFQRQKVVCCPVLPESPGLGLKGTVQGSGNSNSEMLE